MKTKLTFAQRLQRQSVSGQKIKKMTSNHSQRQLDTKPVQPKSRYLNFKEQHNDLKSMLRLFQRPKSPQLSLSPELMPTTPVRRRRLDKKNHNKNEQKPLNIKKTEEVKQNFSRIEWPISLKDTFQSNGSVVLPMSSPCIAEDRRIQTPKNRPKGVKKGIPNIGNTCYMQEFQQQRNALIQCLFHLPRFNDYFVEKKYERDGSERNKNVVEIYRALYYDVMQNREQVEISTLPLKKSVSKICMLFIDWEQQDAHEFMKELINSIHEDLNRVKVKAKYKHLMKDLEGESLDKMASTFWDYDKQREDSYIYDCLCGQIYNNIKCINCTHQSDCFQNFLDLSLPMVPHISSLEELLAQFFQPEKLSDFYLCSNCGKSSKKSTKTLQLWRVPRFLIIHLKRSQFGKKNSEAISIPQSLTLKPYMTISKDKSARYCQYSLCGIIMHRGVMEGGHYWCNVKANGKWFSIDDEKVTDINDQDFKRDVLKRGSSSPYILFYSSLYS